MAKKYAGLTGECMAGVALFTIEDLSMDVMAENVIDLKKKNEAKIYSRSAFVVFSAIANIKSGGRDTAAKFSEGVFYASLPSAELAAYHRLRS
jgi:hypothetical protein